MFSAFSIIEVSLIFVGLAAIIAVAGTYLTKAGDRLADQTGWGEAVIGGILLGAVTSLSGITTSVTAAVDGLAQLSMSNALGGIAAQTLFIAVADLTYRRANLEHASASVPNLMQGSLLILMLTLAAFIIINPEWTAWFFNPASVILIGIYIAGNYIVKNARKYPMWEAIDTDEMVGDIPDKEDEEPIKITLIKFILGALIVGVAGFFVAKAGMAIAEKSPLSESFVGALFTAVATSLPELVVSIAAVRQGALVMAMGNIIGGNSFDILFLAFADFAYTEGSIYHDGGDSQLYILMLALLLNAILILGMLHRQKHGLAKSGWESFTIIGMFIFGYIVMYFQ